MFITSSCLVSARKEQNEISRFARNDNNHGLCQELGEKICAANRVNLFSQLLKNLPISVILSEVKRSERTSSFYHSNFIIIFISFLILLS